MQHKPSETDTHAVPPWLENLEEAAKTEDLRRQFDDVLPKYQRLKEEAKFILEEALQKRAIKVHSIQCRTKEFDSFLQKARTKQYADPLQETDDICGLRVVCLFLSDLDRIGDTIRDSFAVVKEDNKVEGPDVSSFGYSAVHYVATMRDSYAGPRYEGIKGLKLEIQVATIAMHAWASVSHYLEYKTEVDIPSHLKKDFHALSGLFYVADKHFEMFFDAREESQRQIVKAFSRPKPPLDAEINLDTLTAYLGRRFPDRRQPERNLVSAVVQSLVEKGYRTIADVDVAIDKAWEGLMAWEADIRVSNPDGFAALGLVNGASLLLDPIDPGAKHSKVVLELVGKFRKLVKH